MPYLRAKSTAAAGAAGAVTLELPEQSIEYEMLVALRDPTSGQTLWEDVGEQQVNNAAGASRVLVVAQPNSVAVGATETVSSRQEPGRPGTITQVNYVANSPGIVGAATNTRTLTLVQGTAQGAGSPARTTLATLALVAGVNAPANALSANWTINSAAFIADAPVEVASTPSGTGLADPGGLVIVTYTAA